MGKVFISYQSDDQALAFEICNYLESQGLTCWIAPRDIHAGEYAGEITRALKNATFLVLVCSSSTATSAHVRNEVALSFSNGSRIIPFFRENASLDDSLEYFLAGKQRVYMTKDKEKSFANLCAVITGSPVETDSAAPKKPWNGFKRITAAIALLVILAGAGWSFLVAKRNAPIDDPVAVKDSTMVADSITPAYFDKPQPVATQPQKAIEPGPKAAPDADTFSGRTIAGYPHGIGTYTFKQARRIDMHDENARTASPGDYITGEWDKGHLIQGKWYGADGTVKGTLIFGKAGDPERDHSFKPCTR